MRLLAVFVLLAIAFALPSCLAKNDRPKVERLVQELPPDAEGVEFAKDGLRAKRGYRLVKDSDSTFAIIFMETGKGGGGKKTGWLECNCFVGLSCYPWMDPGGIVTCLELPGCIRCRMVLKIGEARTEVLQYTRER